MQGQNTTEIEEKLSERLLGPGDDNNDNNFHIDGGHADIPIIGAADATTIMEAGEIVVDPGAAIGGGAGFGQQQQQQPLQPEYRDAPFALAFLAHIGLVFFFAITWGFSALRQQQDSDGTGTAQIDDDDDSSSSSVYLSGLLWLCCFTCLISIAISAVSLQVMMHHSEILIQSSLIGSCCFMAVYAILFLLDGVIWVTIGWTLMLLITACYARSVWHRIPFAAANLRTALSAIQTNSGICVVAYGIAILANLWTVVWVLAFVGVSFKESSCVGDVCKPNMNAVSIILLILSFYWTIQVFQNILHVTVSGVVGTYKYSC